MILRFYPSRDATIYESDPERNTGLDPILQITKLPATSSTSGEYTSSFNSRILIDFDYPAISSSITNLGYNHTSASYHLKLYATEASEISLNYSLEAFPISGSWNMGVGKANTSPATTDGVSWYYLQSKLPPSASWLTSSFAAGSTGSWHVNPGGGNWYTASVNPVPTQTFNYTTTDVDLDISPIVHAIQSGSVEFTGIIVKKTDAFESGTSTIKALNFYSKDTGTIYSPVIEARIDDGEWSGALTASVIDMTSSAEPNILCTNLRPSYKEGARPLIRFAGRYRYPSGFSTQSLFVNTNPLPSGSHYAIKDAASDDFIINFDSTYTKISTNNDGSFIKLHLDSFQPERYYRLLVKVPYPDGYSDDIFDDDWIFKVER
jgi:hypothetical protein